MAAFCSLILLKHHATFVNILVSRTNYQLKVSFVLASMNSSDLLWRCYLECDQHMAKTSHKCAKIFQLKGAECCIHLTCCITYTTTAREASIRLRILAKNSDLWRDRCMWKERSADGSCPSEFACKMKLGRRGRIYGCPLDSKTSAHY